MDQRYYLSLVVLGLLIVGAWAIAPTESTTDLSSEALPGDRTAANTESTGLDSSLVLPTAISDGEAAVPIISLGSAPTVSAKVDETAFSEELSSEKLSAIPNRKPLKKVDLPLLNASYSPPAKSTQNGEENPLTKPDAPSVQFGMPNTQQPLSTLPNNRLVLKPIAKMGNPFANSRSQSSRNTSANDQVPSDPLFQLPKSNRDVKSPRATLTSEASTSDRSPTFLSGGSRGSQTVPNQERISRDQYIWHVVGPNESLESISIQYFGDGKHTSAISGLNRDLFTDPTLLPVGDAIRIPAR